jgi:hypothetical protein
LPGPEGQAGLEGRDAIELLPRRVKVAFALLAFVFVVTLSVLGYVIAQNRMLAKDGAEAHDVLCAIRVNSQARYDRTQAILNATAPSALVFGIPRTELERGQRDLRTTLAEMRRLDCLPPPPPTPATTQDK